jgi:hypothetical protein
MATIHPKPLVAKTRETVWHQRHSEKQRSNQIVESPDIRPVPSTKGTALFLKRFPKGGAPSSGMVFRGEWSAIESYSTQDVVVVRGGISAGTYVCVRNNPPATAPQDPASDPSLGIYWVCLSRGPTWGQYF